MQAGYILERQGMLVVQIKAQFSKFDQFEDESHLNSIFVVRKNNKKRHCMQVSHVIVVKFFTCTGESDFYKE